MNAKRISWGLVVLFVGFVLLFANLGYIDFNWSAVFSLWPVFIILIGIGYLVPEKSGSQYIIVFVTLGILALFAFRGLTVPKNEGFLSRVFKDKDFETEWNSSDSSSENTEKGSKYFESSYEDVIEYADLSIEGGIVSYRLGEPTAKLFEAEAKTNFSNFSLRKIQSANRADLEFNMSSENAKRSSKDNNENSVMMRLNTNPIWSINLEIGAGTADLDLSRYKLDKLVVEGGMASVKAKVGAPASAQSEITFEGGLAEFELELPKGVACRIVMESALSSKNVDGFTKRSDGSYVSGDYDTADKKYTITIESGLSSVKVSQY